MESPLPASAMFTDGVPLSDLYPAFDNHLKEAASWYQIGDLEKAGAYVRNIAENLHAHAGRGVRRTFLLQLVVHLVTVHAPVGAESPQSQAPDREIVRLERRLAAYESAIRRLFALAPAADGARIDHDLTVALDAADSGADKDATETAAIS